MTVDPKDLVDQVVDEASFVRFLTALRNDWDDEQAKESISASSPYGAGANGWENGTIGAFLDTAIAWAEASGARAPEPENAWRRAAHMLLAGKYYE